MSAALWVSLDDPVVPRVLERAFGLPFATAAPDGPLSLDDLSRIARRSGFTMNVRSTLIPLDAGRDQPHLLLRGGRLLAVMSRGATWLLLNAEAGFVRVGERDVLRLLSTDAERESLESYRSLIERVGVADHLAERLARRLGIARASELADWMSNHRDAIQDVDGFVEFALAEPHLLPVPWKPRVPQAEVREVSFDKHIQLQRRRAFRNAAAGLVRGEASLLVSLLGLVLIGMPIGYLVPLCLAYLIDRARSVGDAPGLVLGLLVLALMVAVAIGAVRSLGFVRLGARIRIRLLNAFLFRLLGCRIQRLRGLSDGDISARLSDLFVAQNLLFGQTLPSILSTLMLAGGLVYLGTVAPRLLVPLSIAVVLIAAIYAVIAPRLRDLTRERLVAQSTWRERLIERFENWKLFRHYDPDDGMLPRIDPHLAATVDLSQRGSMLGALLTWSTALVALGFLGAAWSIGVRGFQSAQYSLGQFLVLMGLAIGAFRGVVGMASLVTAWIRAEPSIRRLREMVDHTEPESDSLAVHGDGSGSWSGLGISDLTFSWPLRAPTLSRLSLAIGPSEWVAIVGKSGSGKSTLAYVLGGLVEPDEGEIVVGGAGRAIGLDELRRHVAIVPQEPTLFDATFKENVMTGLASVPDEDLLRAVASSDLSEFVQKRRRGLDEFVGENGSQVSVGEKARIALARALVREPQLLVLDETFGHLDEATTGRIVDNLKRERFAVILLTHDESLARRCDRVYRLRDGHLDGPETGRE